MGSWQFIIRYWPYWADGYKSDCFASCTVARDRNVVSSEPDSRLASRVFIMDKGIGFLDSSCRWWVRDLFAYMVCSLSLCIQSLERDPVQGAPPLEQNQDLAKGRRTSHGLPGRIAPL